MDLRVFRFFPQTLTKSGEFSPLKFALIPNNSMYNSILHAIISKLLVAELILPRNFYYEYHDLVKDAIYHEESLTRWRKFWQLLQILVNIGLVN